jgi:hypothetical protein
VTKTSSDDFPCLRFSTQDTNQTLYLIQMLIDKPSRAVQVTIKVSNSAAPAEAAQRIADVLRSSLAGYQ